MGTRSKFRRHSTKEADARIAAKKERLHLPCYNWIRFVDDMSKKPHKRKTVGYAKIA